MYKTLWLHEFYTKHLLLINLVYMRLYDTEIVYFRMLVRVRPPFAIIKRFIFVAISSILALTVLNLSLIHQVYYLTPHLI